MLNPLTVKRPRGLLFIAVLMILFGLAEVVTGFTHSFFGINTSTAAFFTYSAAAIGVFYAAAGLLILTMRKPAAAIAIALLVIDVIGRLALVATGFYPTDTLRNTFSIIAGTAIVILFAIYIGWKWKAFQ
jgi:hypothetical protein